MIGFLFLFFVLLNSGRTELLIAVPDTTLPQQQSFNPIYIHQKLHQPTPQQTPTESKSFNIFQQAQNQFGIGRSDKTGGLTITIKLDGSQLKGIQDQQGSNVPNPTPQRHSYIQQSNSIAEVLNGGANLISQPFIGDSPGGRYPQETNTEIPLMESNSFLKSMTNLIKSQISALMDSQSKSSTGPLQTSQSQQYALFAPISSTQQPQLGSNIANFLQKFQQQSTNSIYPEGQVTNPNKPQVHIAKPIQIPSGSGGSPPLETLDNEDSTGPMSGAFSAIVKSVSSIPSNLDLMFNDMGRVYRQNLFQLRDKISEHPWSSMVPGIKSSPSKTKVELNPWLDDFGA